MWVVLVIDNTSPMMEYPMRINVGQSNKTNRNQLTRFHIAKYGAEMLVKRAKGEEGFRCIFPQLCALQDNNGENSADFKQNIKDTEMKPTGGLEVGQVLGKVFEFLHLDNALHDPVGFGRFPQLATPAYIFVFTCDGYMERINIPGLRSEGANMFLTPFRWNQRMYTVLLSSDELEQTEGLSKLSVDRWLGLLSKETYGSLFYVNTLDEMEILLLLIGNWENHWKSVNGNRWPKRFEALRHKFTSPALPVDVPEVVIKFVNPQNGDNKKYLSPMRSGCVRANEEGRFKAYFVQNGLLRYFEKYTKHAGFWPIPIDQLPDKSSCLFPRWSESHPLIYWREEESKTDFVGMLKAYGIPWNIYPLRKKSEFADILKHLTAAQCCLCFASEDDMRRNVPFGFLRKQESGSIQLNVCPYNFLELIKICEYWVRSQGRFEKGSKEEALLRAYCKSLPPYYSIYLRNNLPLFRFPNGIRPIASVFIPNLTLFDPRHWRVFETYLGKLQTIKAAHEEILIAALQSTKKWRQKFSVKPEASIAVESTGVESVSQNAFDVSREDLTNEWKRRLKILYRMDDFDNILLGPSQREDDENANIHNVLRQQDKYEQRKQMLPEELLSSVLQDWRISTTSQTVPAIENRQIGKLRPSNISQHEEDYRKSVPIEDMSMFKDRLEEYKRTKLRYLDPDMEQWEDKTLGGNPFRRLSSNRKRPSAAEDFGRDEIGEDQAQKRSSASSFNITEYRRKVGKGKAFDVPGLSEARFSDTMPLLDDLTRKEFSSEYVEVDEDFKQADIASAITQYKIRVPYALKLVKPEKLGRMARHANNLRTARDTGSVSPAMSIHEEEAEQRDLMEILQNDADQGIEAVEAGDAEVEGIQIYDDDDEISVVSDTSNTSQVSIMSDVSPPPEIEEQYQPVQSVATASFLRSVISDNMKIMLPLIKRPTNPATTKQLFENLDKLLAKMGEKELRITFVQELLNECKKFKKNMLIPQLESRMK